MKSLKFLFSDKGRLIAHFLLAVYFFVLIEADMIKPFIESPVWAAVAYLCLVINGIMFVVMLWGTSKSWK